jgi:hypothetical protein
VYPAGHVTGVGNEDGDNGDTTDEEEQVDAVVAAALVAGVGLAVNVVVT